MHLSVDALTGGIDGRELAAYLEQNGVFVEYADAYHVVLLCSAANTDGDFDILEELLERFAPTGSGAAEKCELPRPETVCGIREAALAPQEIVPFRSQPPLRCRTAQKQSALPRMPPMPGDR